MGNNLGFAKKVLAGASVAAIMATMAPTTFAAFSDVQSGDWYSTYVNNLVGMGVVSGYEDGTFRPNNPINRAEMSKIAVKIAAMSDVIMDENDLAGAPSYSDVPSDQWFYGYVSAASKAKIFEGYRDANGNLTGDFGPGNLVNRAEASKILLLAAGVPAMLTPAAPFTDVNPSDWFYQYVTSAYNWSIIDGYKDGNGNLTGKFGPGDPVTRAQISKIAVLSQSPVDRITGETPSNMNSNSSNTNDNSSNANDNSVVTSDVTFVASVASSSPAPTTLATGTAYNTVLKVDLTAGDQEDVEVNGLTLNHRGISTNSVVSGVLVRDMDGMRHGNVVSFSDNDAYIDLSSDPIMVAAGTTQTIAIQVNFANPAGFSSGTFRVEIPSDGIMATGADTMGTVTVNGTFPLSGAEHSLVAGSNIANVTLDNVAINTSKQNADIGVTREISRFRITENNSNEDVELHELTVFNNGNASDSDIENIRLVAQGEGTLADGTKVLAGDTVATVDHTSNRYATFDLSANPLIIPKGTPRNFSIFADIVDGSTRTIQFVVYNDYDMMIRGQTSGAYILPTAGSIDTAFPIGDEISGDTTEINMIEINEGSLTVSKATSSPNGEISRGGTEVTIAEFKLEAAGEDIEIQGGNLNIQTSSGASTELKNTIRLMNGSGATIHSFNVSAANASMFNTVANDAGDNIARFNNYYTVKAGTTGLLKVVVDVSDSATPGSTLKASIQNLSVKKLASNRFGTAATSEVEGNDMSITAASLTVAKDTSVGDTNIVKGATNQKIGAFSLTTTNSEAVNVNSITVKLNDTANVTNLKLFLDDKTQLDTTKGTLSASGDTFSVSGQVNLEKAQSRLITIYADVASGYASGTIQATLTAGGVTATGVTSSNSFTAPKLVNVDLQSNPVVDNGTVSVNYHSGQNSMVASAGEQIDAFQFEVKAANREDMKLDRAIVAFPKSSASVASVSLYDGETLVGGPLTVTNGTADFSGLNVMIEKNKTKVITAKASLTSSSSFNSNSELVGALNYYEVVGQASGIRTKRTAGASIVGNAAYTHSYALDDLVYTYDLSGNAGDLGIVTAAGTTPTSTYVATAAGDVLGKMATLGTYTPATGSTTPLYVGQVVFDTDDGALERVTAAGTLDAASALRTDGGAVANGAKVSVMPVKDAAEGQMTGDLLINGSTLSFATADGALAANTTAFPSAWTESIASAAKPTVSKYQIGDVVAYDTDLTGNNPSLGVVTAVTSTDVAINGTNFVGAGAGGRITKLFTGSGQGKAHILQNVRPAIAAQSLSFSPTTNAQVGKFTVTATGNEELNLNQFVFSIAGSYNGTLGNFKLYQVQGSSETELSATATLADDNNGTGSVVGYIDGDDPKAQNVTVALAAPYTIQPGTTATFVLKADASAAKTAGTQGSVSLSLQLNGQSGVRDTRNSVTYSYTDSKTSPTTFTGLTESNSYVVNVGDITIN